MSESGPPALPSDQESDPEPGPPEIVPYEQGEDTVAPELPQQATRPYTYDPTEDREKARGQIAKVLVGTLVLVVLFSFLTLWFSSAAVKPADLKDLLSVLLAPIAALAGSAVGFYFGGKSAG